MPFWGADFYGAENVLLMSWEERGLYQALLWHAWIHGSIPADPDAIARLVHAEPAWFATRWAAIAPCWTERDGRLRNARLDAERGARDSYRSEQRRKSAIAAERRTRGSPADAPADGPAGYPRMVPRESLPSHPIPSQVPEGTSPSVLTGTVQDHAQAPAGWFPAEPGRGALRDDQLPESVDTLLLAIGYRSNSQTQLVDVFRATERFKREGGTLDDMRRLCRRALDRGKNPAAMLAAWVDKSTWPKELDKRS